MHKTNRYMQCHGQEEYNEHLLIDQQTTNQISGERILAGQLWQLAFYLV